MAAYVTVSFNHFAAIQGWANEAGAEANLDMRDFTMEVKHRGRYYRMYPMFQGRTHGRLVHLPQLTPDVTGFGGWRPYQTLTHPYSNDKQLFKTYLRESDLRSPASWELRDQPPGEDYVLKARSSSFGRGLFGPYHAGQMPSVGAEAMAPYGVLFAEQFVQGRMLKVWYWGARPFFAHMQEYPAIIGDGRSTVHDLLQRRRPDVIYVPDVFYGRLRADILDDPGFPTEYEYFPPESLGLVNGEPYWLGIALRRSSRHYEAMRSITAPPLTSRSGRAARGSARSWSSPAPQRR